MVHFSDVCPGSIQEKTGKVLLGMGNLMGLYIYITKCYTMLYLIYVYIYIYILQNITKKYIIYIYIIIINYYYQLLLLLLIIIINYYY